MKPGTADTARSWRGEDLVVSVELGFGAASTASCGLYRKPEARNSPGADHKNFGDALDATARWISEADGPVALVIEAPLSFFWREGCPHGRLTLRDRSYPLESRRVWKRNKKTGQYELTAERRYWYVAPGSTVTLAASFFLRSLSHVVARPRWEQLYLFEGFASFKACGFQPQAPIVSEIAALTHGDEAVALANSLASAADLAPDESVKSESILDAFNIGHSGAGLPAVIDVYPGEVPRSGDGVLELAHPPERRPNVAD
jgi:hypothetical protein